MPLPRLIPCLDVANGRVVKGVSFVGLRDVGDPVELATYYSAGGADELVFLDIAATPDDTKTMTSVVAQVADVLEIPFTVGGGVRSVEDASRIIESGADRVSLNSAALAEPWLITAIADRYGSQAVVVAIDAGEGVVHTHGGRVATKTPTLEWAIEAASRGAGEILLTSIRQDGKRTGFDLELTDGRAQFDLDSGDRIRWRGLGPAHRRCVASHRCGTDRLDRPREPFGTTGTSSGDREPGSAFASHEGAIMNEQLKAAIIQDDATGRVLMLGWMDGEALELTRSTGLVTFYSRSRQQLWVKGETSGNSLHVVEVVLDCDEDAVLVRVNADGPACHDGSTSCFTPWLWRKILQREAEGSDASYVARTLREGTAKTSRKVGEEAVEVVVAALSEDDERVVSEAADLWFHTLLLLRSRGLDPAAVEDELRRRSR